MRFLAITLAVLTIVSCNKTQQESTAPGTSLRNDSAQPCIESQVRWNISKKEFIDTVITYRQLNSTDTNKLVVCNPFKPELEKITYDLSYLQQLVNWADGSIRTSLLALNPNSDSTYIANYYLITDSSQQVAEMQRFLLTNDGEVVGINILPNIVEGFTPIDVFNEPDTEVLDDVIIVEEES